MFDADPFDRKAYGATRHCIYQSCDDVNHLMVGLEFSSAEAAMTFVEALQPVWGVSGAGQAWVLQEAELATY
jgi:hypothetical protein